jgi:hypothetical protein
MVTDTEAEAAYDLSEIGATVRSDFAGSDALDGEFITAQQALMVEAAAAMPAIARNSRPTVDDAPPEEAFMPVFTEGWPLYEHLLDAGFFESTTSHLPRYTPAFLESLIPRFVESEALAAPLADLDLEGTAGSDMIATVAGNADELSTHHWIATDEINRELFEGSEYIPSTTQGVAGGSLLWLESLDHHLWTHAALLTDEIHQSSIWHGQSLSAGLNLMVEGAREVAGENTRAEPISDSELGALLSMGFAVQAIASGLLPSDVHWITEEMRAPKEDSDVELTAVAETGAQQ